MESVNVLVTSRLSDECLQQIAGVSPRMRLTVASDFLRIEWSADPASKERLDALLAEAEVIFGFVSPQYIIPRAPKLKWIQVATAGVERLLDAQMIESPMILTNVSGIHATVSGTMEDYIMRATEVFLENLRRYLSGKRLLNVVNKKKGY